jgi:predicted TIM-barrel fold metal-dependent hydrolase
MIRLAIAATAAGCAKDEAPRPYDGPIIDFHAHVEFGPLERSLNPNVPATGEELLRQMDSAGVGSGCVITMAPRGDLGATRQRNDAVIALARKHPERFRPVGSVHPDDGDAALAEMERIASVGVRVLKLHPNSQKFDVASAGVKAVVAKAASLRMVVLFDGWSPFDPAQVGKFVELAIAHRDARIVLAHACGARFQELVVVQVLNKYPWYPRNVWIDLSAVAPMYADSPYRDQLAWVARQVGVDRVLFGSDFPLYSLAESVAAVRRLGFTTEELRRILHDNAAELLAAD